NRENGDDSDWVNVGDNIGARSLAAGTLFDDYLNTRLFAVGRDSAVHTINISLNQPDQHWVNCGGQMRSLALFGGYMGSDAFTDPLAGRHYTPGEVHPVETMPFQVGALTQSFVIGLGLNNTLSYMTLTSSNNGWGVETLTGFSSWVSLPGPALRSFTLAGWNVIGVGKDGTVWCGLLKKAGGGLTVEWSSLGRKVQSLVAGVNGVGYAEIYADGGDGKVWHRAQNPYGAGWLPWTASDWQNSWSFHVVG